MKTKTTKVEKIKDQSLPEDIKPVEKVEVKNRGWDRPKELKNGLCIICNDPVNQEAAVYGYACHADCVSASGDSIIQQRIKELKG